jgi:hypothetical protein
MPALPVLASPPVAPGDAFSPAVAEAMLARIARLDPKSGAEALRELRHAFPDSPLAWRVAALNLLMLRREGKASRP